VFFILMAWFEGEVVFYLVYTLSYFHRIAFHFIHVYLIYLLLHFYATLYLVDYACHYARISKDEM
jgi:hypothetical protein